MKSDSIFEIFEESHDIQTARLTGTNFSPYDLNFPM